MQRVTLYNSFGLHRIFPLWLPATYLVLAPVYRIPSVPSVALSGIKAGLFLLSALIAVHILLTKTRSPKIPWGFTGLSFIPVAMVFAIPGLWQSETESILRFVENYIYIAAALIVGIAIAHERDTRALFRLLALGGAACAAFSLMVQQDQPTDVILSSAGLGTLRTGWSNGLSHLAVAALCITVFPGQKLTTRLVFGIAYVLISYSQIETGGRAGLVMPILAVGSSALFLGVFGPLKRQKFLVVIFLSAVAMAFIFWSDVEQILRLTRSTGVYISALDAASSGRIASYLQALNLINEKPFIGYGFDDPYATGLWTTYFVHNLWLKLWYQSGPVYLLVVGIFALSVVKNAVRNDRANRFMGQQVLTPFILNGVGLSMLEPNALIGSFQASAAWWVMAGIVLGQKEMKSLYQQLLDPAALPRMAVRW